MQDQWGPNENEWEIEGSGWDVSSTGKPRNDLDCQVLPDPDIPASGPSLMFFGGTATTLPVPILNRQNVAIARFLDRSRLAAIGMRQREGWLLRQLRCYR